MGQLIRKASCVSGKHEDSTPSMAIYSDGTAYCFACCSFFKDLQAPVAEVKKEPENLADKLEYISQLPSIDHRGLSFKHDSRGYYIVWPDKSYYKYRLWAPRADEPKYLGAKGHKKGWFILKSPKPTEFCIITEGEINALSLFSSFNSSEYISTRHYDILSPGGSSNFFDGEMKAKVALFKQYATLLVLVDADKAGVEGVINFHKLAKPYCNDIRIKLMPKGNDANEELINYGPAKLRQTILDM